MKLLRAIKGLYEVWEDVDPGADLDSHLDGLLNHSLFPASAFYKNIREHYRTLIGLSPASHLPSLGKGRILSDFSKPDHRLLFLLCQGSSMLESLIRSSVWCLRDFITFGGSSSRPRYQKPNGRSFSEELKVLQSKEWNYKRSYSEATEVARLSGGTRRTSIRAVNMIRTEETEKARRYLYQEDLS